MGKYAGNKQCRPLPQQHVRSLLPYRKDVLVCLVVDNVTGVGYKVVLLHWLEQGCDEVCWKQARAWNRLPADGCTDSATSIVDISAWDTWSPLACKFLIWLICSQKVHTWQRCQHATNTTARVLDSSLRFCTCPERKWLNRQGGRNIMLSTPEIATLHPRNIKLVSVCFGKHNIGITCTYEAWSSTRGARLGMKSM